MSHGASQLRRRQNYLEIVEPLWLGVNLNAGRAAVAPLLPKRLDVRVFEDLPIGCDEGQSFDPTGRNQDPVHRVWVKG
jgi:hypothetical protein